MKFVSWKATPSAATVSRSASGAPSSGAMMRPTAAALPFMYASRAARSAMRTRSQSTRIESM